jgi:hypothetical protein
VLAASFDTLWYPANSASGTSWFGVGPPFVLGAAFLLTGVVGMALFWAFSKRARLFFARKMETVDAMVPWDDEAQDQRGAQPATLQAAEMQRPGKAA